MKYYASHTYGVVVDDLPYTSDAYAYPRIYVVDPKPWIMSINPDELDRFLPKNWLFV